MTQQTGFGFQATNGLNASTKGYGSWYSIVSQSANANNVGVPMAYEITDFSNGGVSIVSDGTALTKITFANAGVYNLQFSSQFQNTNNQLQDINIWLRKNGTTDAANVSNSNSLVSISNSHGAGAINYGHGIVAWNFLLNVSANDYYQLVWSTSLYTAVTMQYYGAGSPPPATPSVILTVMQQ